MSAFEKARARFGANVAESMGANRAGGLSATAARPADPFEGTERFADARMIEVASIEADPDQPRTEFDPGELESLAGSLKDHGQLQPIIVRPGAAPGRFVIISGERRHRASVLAGRPTIAAVIKHVSDPIKIFEMQIAENCQRADLKPVEQARGFRRHMQKAELSAERMGQVVGISESAVIRALALLSLPAPVQAMVDAGRLSPSIAYEISKGDPATHQAMADRVVGENLNRIATIEAVRQGGAKAGGSKSVGKGGKPRGKAKVATKRTFKADAGLRITAERAKGVEPAALAEAFERFAAEIRVELALADADAVLQAARAL